MDLGPLLWGPAFEHIRDDDAVFASSRRTVPTLIPTSCTVTPRRWGDRLTRPDALIAAPLR
jgi:hypothetical protein